MKYLVSLFMLVATASLASAQTAKYALLDAKDPAVGEWEWVKSDTGAPAAPLPDQEWLYLKIAAGTEQSMGATGYDEDKGYSCPTYFMAFGNGTMITGTVSGSCTESDKGKKVSFGYFYDEISGQLEITLNGEKFLYKRRS